MTPPPMAPVRFWYVTYSFVERMKGKPGASGALFAAMPIEMRGEFNLAVVFHALMMKHRQTCIVLDWKELSARQYADFLTYCTKVTDNAGKAIQLRALPNLVDDPDPKKGA